jgi:predicted ribosome quality control (RQC) complex YloA/Tae2 family protein
LLRHYLTFAHQAATLDEAVSGQTLAECWSQEKGHLLLRFIRGSESTFVEFAVDLRLGYALLKRDAHRARRNTIDFFGSLLGTTLKHVSIDEGERVIRLHFADGRQLAVFFFGKGSGNVLLTEGEAVLDSFMKYSGEYDRLIGSESHEEHRSREEILERLRGGDDPPAKALARAIPELGSRLAVEAIDRVGLGRSAPLKDATDEQLLMLLAEVDSLYAACDSSETFYLYHLPDEVVFALTRLRSLESSAEQIETFDELGHAIHAYRSSARTVRRFADVRSFMTKRLAVERARLERSIAKRYNADEHFARADEWERQANTLLAHLHEIERGSARAVVTDWEGNLQEIALDPKQTPAENAERLFRRARGAREAAARDAGGREKIEGALKRIERLAGEVERSESVKELERIEADNQELFRMTGEAREEGTAERFRRFDVGGHEIYVGKNASNNDELTVRFARPNDYWFHARGSSGSHVVLRWNDPKSKPPKEALRAAASLAAYYSGAKNAKMVPVAYTLKKHVRKPRGAAVGAVVMEREEVIMVEPKLPE